VRQTFFQAKQKSENMQVLVPWQYNLTYPFLFFRYKLLMFEAEILYLFSICKKGEKLIILFAPFI